MPAPLRDHDVVARYEATYGLAGITIEQARRHLELETALTQELLESAPETRRETFARCYDTLYSGLPWLRDTGDGGTDADRWLQVIGSAPKSVYEVGSGNGRFAQVLARAGHTVEATDISGERGGRGLVDGVRWSVTDGVHLARYATGAPYDVVVSDQVVEHLHPDDLDVHCAGCAEILRPGGRYVVRTPHRLTGPHDVSAIFGYDRPVGMHLREYGVAELRAALRRNGFGSVFSIMTVPRSGRLRSSRAHLAVQMASERALGALPAGRRPLLRGPLRPAVWLIAHRVRVRGPR